MVAPLRGRVTDRGVFTGLVREISHPRENAGAETELHVFEATACPAVTAVFRPAAAVTVIADADIASSPKRCLPWPPELLARLKRSRLSNALPISGEGRR
jgi:hypothetical protein